MIRAVACVLMMGGAAQAEGFSIQDFGTSKSVGACMRDISVMLDDYIAQQGAPDRVSTGTWSVVAFDLPPHTIDVAFTCGRARDEVTLFVHAHNDDDTAIEQSEESLDLLRSIYMTR